MTNRSGVRPAGLACIAVLVGIVVFGGGASSEIAGQEQKKQAPVIPPLTGKREVLELFNGKDLTGWVGHDEYWSLQNGVIVGRNDTPIKVSTYLLTQRKFSDFRLIFDFKLARSEMHSGIALWGGLAPEQGDPYTYAGHLVMFPSGYGYYDLYGRRSLGVNNRDIGQRVGHQHGWNHIEILAQGNRIRFVLNGCLAADWRDTEPERIKHAPIGLQLHSNKMPQEVQFKGLVLETFPENRLITLKEPALPQRDSMVLTPSAKLGRGPDKENSGIVKSRNHKDLFWMQNDSGDHPRVYPIRRNGEVYRSSRYPDSPGVLIGDAINVDWEDITVDADGHLIVADAGNNRNDRRDLVLYYLDEPSPAAGRTSVKKKVFFRYPDQKTFPAPENDFNYDSEALFTAGSTVYILTKNRSDTYTKLYRLDEAKTNLTNTLTYVDRFDVRGRAVGADATADGNRLVIITYDAIWLFEKQEPDDDFFGGKIYWMPYKAGGVEAVCFADHETLILGDEPRGVLYEVKIKDLTQVR